MQQLPAGVAAGHQVTADVGIATLEAGGTAGDAGVAMMLASCVAETIFTGLGGGGFATYYDAGSGDVSCLDFFVAVPGLGERVAGEPVPVDIVMGGHALPYVIGGASVAVPGVPAGAHAVWSRWGRLPWVDVVAPSVAHAAAGVVLSHAHAAVLVPVAPAMCFGAGAAVHQGPDGSLLGSGDRLHFPGLDRALQVLAEEGPAPFYTGAIAAAMLEATQANGALDVADLAAYRVLELPPRSVQYAGATVWSRGNDLDDLLGTLQDLRPDTDPGRFALDLVRALRAGSLRAETTNLVAVDGDGNACALTTSLGLGAGVWADGYGIHLNSMLGEGELLRGVSRPGDRMASMMSPLVAVGPDGLLAVAGAAGGSRIRPALIQTLHRLLAEGADVQGAINAPRLNPGPDLVRCEPGYPEAAIEALRRAGEVVHTTDRLDAYFGGVSAIARDGAGADPRRGGVARLM